MGASMNSVLVGTFATPAAAMAAQRALMAAGFAASALQRTGAAVAAVSAPASTAPSTRRRGLARLLALFSADDARPDERQAAATPASGPCSLTVRTASGDEMDLAERTLRAAGALDVDEQSEEWRDGWTAGTGAGRSNASGGADRGR